MRGVGHSGRLLRLGRAGGRASVTMAPRCERSNLREGGRRFIRPSASSVGPPIRLSSSGLPTGRAEIAVRQARSPRRAIRPAPPCPASGASGRVAPLRGFPSDIVAPVRPRPVAPTRPHAPVRSSPVAPIRRHASSRPRPVAPDRPHASSRPRCVAPKRPHAFSHPGHMRPPRPRLISCIRPGPFSPLRRTLRLVVPPAAGLGTGSQTCPMAPSRRAHQAHTPAQQRPPCPTRSSTGPFTPPPPNPAAGPARLARAPSPAPSGDGALPGAPFPAARRRAWRASATSAG